MIAAALLAVVPAGCDSPPCGLSLCDILDTGCQQRTAAAAACLRALPAVDVPVTVMSRDAYRQQQLSQVTPADQMRAADVWESAFALLDLAPLDGTSADMVVSSANSVAAFYSPADKAITLIDDGQGFDPYSGVILLAHEFTHALQDQAFGGFAGTPAPTDRDGGRAVSAIFEGEATVVQDLAQIGLFGDQPDDVDWGEVFAHWQATARANSAASRYPAALEWDYFDYPFGTPFVHDALSAGGWAAVDALHAALPSGTRQMMAGFGSTAPGGAPWDEGLGDDAIPVLPSSFVLFDFDRMGAWLVDQLAARRIPTSSAAALSSGVRGDLLAVFQEQTTGGLLLSWRLRFDDPVQAASFPMQALLPNATFTQVDGRDVICLIADPPTLIAQLPSLLTFQAAPSVASTDAAMSSASGRGGPFRCGAHL